MQNAQKVQKRCEKNKKRAKRFFFERKRANNCALVFNRTESEQREKADFAEIFTKKAGEYNQAGRDPGQRSSKKKQGPAAIRTLLNRN